MYTWRHLTWSGEKFAVTVQSTCPKYVSPASRDQSSYSAPHFCFEVDAYRISKLRIRRSVRVQQAAMGENPRRFKFSIDRGGTFTDVFCEIETAKGVVHRTAKLLSVDPLNYNDAPTEGIRRILEKETGIPQPRGKPIRTAELSSIRMGTTVATNALLERQGERTALVVTRGFKDLLLIGNQTRPSIFELDIQRPDLIYEHVVEVDEDVIIPVGTERTPRNGLLISNENDRGTGTRTQAGETVYVRKEIDKKQVETALKEVRRAGINSLAIVLKHAAVFPDHEVEVASVAQELGFSHVSLSHQVMPMVKMVSRGFTAAADAYLTPHIVRYLETFRSGFDSGLGDVELAFMRSDGGLSPADAFSGQKAILSGPAAGYVGYAATTKWEGMPTEGPLQIIGFDMGGTSTDVSRHHGMLEHVMETTTAGVTIQAPQLDINTVAAGGGSRLFYRDGVFVVGPESAGADPGPVCYRKRGGTLAVTDANAALGRIVPDYFPKIFGPDENLPLDVEGSVNALSEIAAQVNAAASAAGQQQKSIEEVALGFIDVANEAMCRPIRALTQARGFDPSQHVLACFGGAGGQHACAIASKLGMRTVFVHRYASILSAVGMGLASVVQEAQEPVACVLQDSEHENLEEHFDRLAARAVSELVSRGFCEGDIDVIRFLNLRFQGTDVALMVASDRMSGYEDEFLRMYRREFGFVLQGRQVIVDDVRIAGTQLPITEA